MQVEITEKVVKDYTIILPAAVNNHGNAMAPRVFKKSGRVWSRDVAGNHCPLCADDAYLLLDAIIEQRSKCNCGSGCCCKS